MAAIWAIAAFAAWVILTGAAWHVIKTTYTRKRTVQSWMSDDEKNGDIAP